MEDPPEIHAWTTPTRSCPRSPIRSPRCRLAHAAWLGEWRQQPEGTVRHVTVARRTRPYPGCRRVDAAPDGLWAPAELTLGLLADYGIPVVPTAHASSAAEAAATARELGFPVALKAAAPELVHKTDVGGVRLGPHQRACRAQAFAEMRAALGPAMGGAIVQPMVPPGIELIVGINHDPTFGPLVLFGMGGFDAELHRDTALVVPPLTDADIDRLLRSLRGSPLLFGFRSSDPSTSMRLRDLMSRIGLLAQDVAEIAELDCNPVVVSPGGALVVDAKLRLVTLPMPPGPFELD